MYVGCETSLCTAQSAFHLKMVDPMYLTKEIDKKNSQYYNFKYIYIYD